MKIYARQMSPESQESSLMLNDSYPEGIILTGNRHFNSHTTPAYDNVVNHFEEMTGEWNYIGRENSAYKNFTDCIMDYLPPDHKANYSTVDIHAWRQLVKHYFNIGEKLDGDIICKALELITGKKYNGGTIRGCSQGDWQDIYYPADYSKEFIDAFEMEYFNLGTEWIIHDEEGEPADPDNICGYSVYCYSYDTDGIKKEIADAAGGTPEDVVLYQFDRYIQTPVYKEV